MTASRHEPGDSPRDPLESIVSLVESEMAYVAVTDHLYADAFKPGVATYPIPFFGDLLRAQVITVGLNPSATEFEDRQWPAGLSAVALTDRLRRYFEAAAHPWFRAWEEALASFGASYHRNAAHVDVTPRATLNAGSVAPDVIERLARADLGWMVKFLGQVPDLRVVLVAGSLNKHYYLNEFLQAALPTVGAALAGAVKRPRGEKGFLLRHSLTLPGCARPVSVLFCSSGPSDRRNPGLLARRVATDAARLRAKLSASRSA